MLSSHVSAFVGGSHYTDIVCTQPEFSWVARAARLFNIVFVSKYARPHANNEDLKFLLKPLISRYICFNANYSSNKPQS